MMYRPAFRSHFACVHDIKNQSAHGSSGSKMAWAAFSLITNVSSQLLRIGLRSLQSWAIVPGRHHTCETECRKFLCLGYLPVTP
jgi:hypothetical protein